MSHTTTFNRKELYTSLLTLAIPMVIQNAITNAVGLVDNIMVGSLGTEAITAVSIAIQLVFVYSIAIFGGLSGPGIYGAQYYGSGDTKGFQSVVRIKWWIAIFCIIAGALIFFFFGEALLKLYLTGESADINAELTLSYAKEYLNIMFIGLIPFSITQIYAGSLRESGDSFKPMIAGICSVIADIVFNYILIFGHFGFPKLGIQGAAIATVIGRILEMFVIVIWAHARKDKHIFLVGLYKTFKVPFNITITVLKKGSPIFLNELLWSAGIAIMTQCYSTRGLVIVAGLNISNAICNLLSVAFVTLGSATGIIVGQILGASEYEKAKKSGFSLMFFSAGVSAVLMVILILISFKFPSLYNTSDLVREYSTYFIIITACFFPVQGMLNALYFTLRSGGKTVITFLFDSFFSTLVSIPLAFILCNFTDLNIFIVYAFVNCMDIIKVIVGIILIRKGIWINNLVTNLQTE